MEHILYTHSGGTASITLNRPAKRNALNSQMIAELHDAFNDAESRRDVHAIVLRANGSAFCAGADLSSLRNIANNGIEDNLRDSRQLKNLFHTIFFSSKPSIAIVQGAALAGGCGLATLCDITIASSEAVFGYTEVRIGFIPAIVMVFLRHKIGEASARELVLRGNMISAEEARRIGLITHVAPTENLEETAQEILSDVLKGSSSSQKLSKKMFAVIPGMSVSGGLEYAATMNAFARQTEECKNGIAQFLSRSSH